LIDGDVPLTDAHDDGVRLRLQEQRARHARLRAELRALVSEADVVASRAAAARQLARIRQVRHRAAEEAFERGAVSRFELLRVWQESMAQAADLQAAEQQTAALEQRVAAQRHAVREVQAGDRQALGVAIAALEVEVAELEALRAEAGDRRAETRLVAPAAGVVEQLKVAVGEHVERGETLAVIVPVERPLLFEARVPPGQAAFVHPGQMCRIKLDALPFARYGALHCEVASVSHDVVTGDPGVGYYLVRIRPATERLRAHGRLVQLQPGATAWVDIVASRRSVLSFVTEPLRRFAAESLREV
jgi:hemolysin D